MNIVTRLYCFLGYHEEAGKIEIRRMGELDRASKRITRKCLECKKQTYDSGWVQLEEGELLWDGRRDINGQTIFTTNTGEAK